MQTGKEQILRILKQLAEEGIIPEDTFKKIQEDVLTRGMEVELTLEVIGRQIEARVRTYNHYFP